MYRKRMLSRFSAWLLVLLYSGTCLAQLSSDPSSVPVPPAAFNDPHRAVVVRVQFDSATSVTPGEVSVARARARGSIANPSQLLLELLDHNDQVIREQFAHHPLWVRDIDEEGQESGVELSSGPAVFLVPLSETLRKVRITDLERDQALVTVDVSEPVLEYCRNTPQTPICALFLNGFE